MVPGEGAAEQIKQPLVQLVVTLFILLKQNAYLAQLTNSCAQEQANYC